MPWRTIARPNQLPPDGDWLVWLLLAGRGFGKTRTVNEWAHERAMTMPGSRGHIVASTAGDVRDVVVEGQSGMTALHPEIQYEPSKRRLTWPNGSMATLFSADEPNRLRGPQCHWAICDELASWRYPEAFDMLMLGLRLGESPRCAVATTPRPIPIIRKLIDSPTTHVTRGTTYENKDNLADSFFRQIVSQYEGSRLGRQEINAEILDDVEGALWMRNWIDMTRVSVAPDMVRIVTAIDPAVTGEGDSAETGIIVAGKGTDGQGYVLGDYSLRATPEKWASEAVSAYTRHRADRIIGEINNGGDMVELTLRTVNPGIPYTAVYASRGKQTRAEPISALYEQGRIHHVGTFADLEDQLCSWVPGTGASPDRLDALVWAFTELDIAGDEAYSEAINAPVYRIGTSDY